jgi:hypothetical protein
LGWLPANAAWKKRKLYYHLLRRLNRLEFLYHRDIAADDWSEEHHDAIKKSVERGDGLYLAFDNQVSLGIWAYLSTVPLRDFRPLDDVDNWLIQSIKGIRPPEYPVKGQRFRPIRGSHELTSGCDAPIDENAGKYVVVAKSTDPTDWAAVEADLRERRIPYESIKPVYRAQHGTGIKFQADRLGSVQNFALCLEGYTLTKGGRPKHWKEVATHG